jgi:hypothetical protein
MCPTSTAGVAHEGFQSGSESPSGIHWMKETEMMFGENADVRRLAGARAHLLLFMEYDEEGGRRNYYVEFRRERFGYTGDGLWYSVHIQLNDPSATNFDRDNITVTVDADWRRGGEIGRFKLAIGHHPSPISLDPAAIQQAIEIMLADLSRELGKKRPKA